VGSSVVKDVVEGLEEYLENVDYLKSSTTSLVKRCRWFQIIDMLNNLQISPKRNCSTLAIPWRFYKISRAFDGFSMSIIWQKYHPPELKYRPIFPLVFIKEEPQQEEEETLKSTDTQSFNLWVRLPPTGLNILAKNRRN